MDMTVDTTITITVTTGVLVAVHLMLIVNGDFVSAIGELTKDLDDVNMT